MSLKEEFLELYNSEIKPLTHLKFDHIMGHKKQKHNKKISHFKKR